MIANSRSSRKKGIPLEKTHHSLILEGVSESEQTLEMHKPFWVFMGGNLGISTWLMGVIVAGMGLNFADALFVIVVGGLVGTLLPALTALIGPKSGLSQMEAARFALGKTGKKIPAFFNWINAIGWDVVNNVISATAFKVLCLEFGYEVPIWLALAILVGIQLVIGVYGHHLIQNTARYTGSVLMIFFLLIGLVAMERTGFKIVSHESGDIKGLLSSFILVVAFNVGWTTSTADYTRYLPKHTPLAKIFNMVFSSLFLSLLLLSFFGYMTASVVQDPSPEGVMMTLQSLSGHFAPLVMFFIWFNSIPANAMNDNSAAYTLISTGFKMSRPTSAIFGAVVGYFGSLFATQSFLDFFEEFLLLFAHWITPWAAIVLVHWFVIGKKIRQTPSGITPACWLLLSIASLSLSLFSVSPFYEGPLARYLLGLDFGPYFGFVAAAGIYYLWLKWITLSKRKKQY